MVEQHLTGTEEKMSETEQEGTEDVQSEDAETQETPSGAPPDNVDPVTGELLEPGDDGDGDEQETGDEERRRELAAEKQEAEQAQAASEAEIERQQKALDRATKAYTDKLTNVLGDDLSGFTPCPMCAEGWPGIRLPVMPSPAAVAQIKVAIGEDPDPDLPDDGYSRRCAACDGWGKVTTGSRVTTQKSAQCLDCHGRGWVAVGTERESGHITVSNGTTGQPAPILQDNASNDPPEVAMLKQLGYIVVEPIQSADVPPVAGV